MVVGLSPWLCPEFIPFYGAGAGGEVGVGTGWVMLPFCPLPPPSRRRIYKEHLGLSQKVAIGYQAHADTATKSGSLTKNKFVV